MRPIRGWRAGGIALAAALTMVGVARSDSSKELFVIEELTNSMRFETDGSAKIESFARVRVQSQAAVQQLGQLLLPFIESRETISLESLRVLAEDGTVDHEGAALVQTLPAPVTGAFPLYSDLQILHVTAPAFEAGDVLEYRWIREVHNPEAPGQFWMEHAFQREALVEAETLVVDVPAGVDVRWRHAAKVRGEAVERDGRRIWTWRHSHLERAAEGDDESGDWDLSMSSFASWSQLGSWYQELRGDRAQPTDAVRSKAAEVTGGLQDPPERLEALYHFVSTKHRYVGLLFGLARYRPHAAERTLESGYGDCKDKHTLFAALARSQGFEVSAVLIGAQRDELEEAVPSPAQFDHVITAVKLDGAWIYLDPTSGVAPFGYLPPYLRAKRALRIPESGGPELVTTPAAPSIPKRTEVRIVGKVDERGVLTAEVRLRLRGDGEWFARVGFLNLQRSQWLDTARGLLALGIEAKASRLEISELSDTQGPLEISFEIESADWLDASNPRQEAAPVLPSVRAGMGRWADLADDDGTVVLGGPSESWFASEIELPDGFEVEPPMDVEVAIDSLGEYSASYGFIDGSLVAERRISLARERVGPEEEAGYTSLRATVRKDHKQHFRLVTSRVAAANQSSEDERWLYETGQRQIDEDPAAALTAFERVVALDPAYPWGWYEVGRAKEKLEDWDGAREAYRRQGELDPFNSLTFDAVGRTSEKLGDTEGALEAYRRQLENDPLHHESTRRLGQLLAINDHCEEAVDPLRRALAFDSQDCESRRWAAKCLLGPERAEEARRMLADLDGCNLEQLLWITAHCSQAEEEGLAIEVNRRAVELSPTDEDAAGFLLILLLQEGRLEETIATAEELLEHQPQNAELHVLNSGAYRRLGRLPEMAEQLEKALELEPDDVDTRKGLVRAYAEQRRLEPAIRHLEELVRRVPRSDPSLSMLGSLLYETGDLVGAEEALVQAVANDAADQGAAALGLGRLYAGQERYGEAREMLEIARRKMGRLFTDQDLLDYVAGREARDE